MNPHKTVAHALVRATSRLISTLGVLLTLSAAQAAEVVKVISKPTERMIQLPGEFQPYQQVSIFAKVSGFVDKVHVDVGSRVKTGDLLATLVAPELTAHRLEATAKVQAAESQRAEALAKVAAADSTYQRLKAAAATPGVIAGMVPLALAIGEGAEQTAPLGRAVIGGLLGATVATLLVLPAAYAIFQRRSSATSPSLDPDDPTSKYYEPA